MFYPKVRVFLNDPFTHRCIVSLGPHLSFLWCFSSSSDSIRVTWRSRYYTPSFSSDLTVISLKEPVVNNQLMDRSNICGPTFSDVLISVPLDLIPVHLPVSRYPLHSLVLHCFQNKMCTCMYSFVDGTLSVTSYFICVTQSFNCIRSK